MDKDNNTNGNNGNNKSQEAYASVNQKGVISFSPRFFAGPADYPNKIFDESRSGIYLFSGATGEHKCSARISLAEWWVIEGAVRRACDNATMERLSIESGNGSQAYYFDIADPIKTFYKDKSTGKRMPLPQTRIRSNKKMEEALELPAGLTYTRKWSVKRTPVMKDQSGKTVYKDSAWQITISEGGAVEAHNASGGTYPKGGTYVEKFTYTSNLSDIEMAKACEVINNAKLEAIANGGTGRVIVFSAGH